MRQFIHATLAAGALALSPSLTHAAEPLCDWLEGLGGSAQARADGRPGAAALARNALGARPAGEAAARARLELGLALDGSGASQERLEALRTAAGSATPTIRAAVLSALGGVLLDAGEHREAVAAFRIAAAEGTAPIGERARWRAAAALHAGGFAAEAAAAWRPLARGALAENFDLETRLAFAADLRTTGERRRAAEILRSIWTSYPEREEGEAAGTLLVRWREEGDAIPPFAAEERIIRTYRLVAMGRSHAARAELVEAERCEPPPSAETLALAKATTLLAAGKTAEASAEVTRYADSPNAGIRRGVAFLLARAAARDRRFADAIVAWRAVAESSAPVPGLPAAVQASLRDDAEFLAAWLHLDAGDPRRAAEALGRLARLRPGSHRADDIRWFEAWALVRQGANGQADAALRRLEQGPAGPRARYWRARVAPDCDLRVELLRATVAADPLGYYGLLASARLRATGDAYDPPPLEAGPPLPPIETLPDAARLRQASELAASGLREEAIHELAAITQSRGGRLAAPLAAELAAYLGDSLLPFRIARDQIGLSKRSLAWSFPAAWPALVEPASRSTGIDASLLRAVMRRESGFRTEVRSAAGAVGLLQIVPGTSARLSALLNLPETFAERLEEPSVNVPLGATYLSLLLERFGEPLVAVAAYNAGPNAVVRWNHARGGVPLDAWVESIPFRETRDYVRAVVENWAWTRAAAGEPLPQIDPDRIVQPSAAGVGF